MEAASAVLFLGLYLLIDEPECMLSIEKVTRSPVSEDRAAEESTRTRRPGIYPKLQRV
jgi:hypothetical protein